MKDVQIIMSIIVAAISISGAIFAAYKWIISQTRLRDDIRAEREALEQEIKIMNCENQVLCYGLFACLDGLEQLGCNHNVTKAHAALEKHINRRAHGNE